MVEIVNPQDAGLLAEACGSCNQHITVHELRRELEKFRERASLLSASTMGEAFDRLEELVEKEKELAKTRAELDEAKAEQGRIAQRMATALEPYVSPSAIRQALADADANRTTTAEPAACLGEPYCSRGCCGPKADEPWRAFTVETAAIHTGFGHEETPYVLCRLDEACEESLLGPEGRLLTLGEAVDWAKKHAASPFHAAPDATPAQVRP